MPGKVILSRKGFDSASGGRPSPWVGDELISLPIPQAGSGIRFADLKWDASHSYADRLRQLGVPDDIANGEAHLDPDLNRGLLGRPRNWRPAFGQANAAASHLLNQDVSVGDLFIFFGLFCRAEQRDGCLQYVNRNDRRHVIFGYLEVDQIIDLHQKKAPKWAQRHPHVYCRADRFLQRNLLFVGRRKSSFWNGHPGSGLFPFHEPLVLTSDGASTSTWRLPNAFFEKDGRARFSYHRRRFGRKVNATDYEIDTTGRGQEFVCERNNGIDNWLKSLRAE